MTDVVVEALKAAEECFSRFKGQQEEIEAARASLVSARNKIREGQKAVRKMGLDIAYDKGIEIAVDFFERANEVHAGVVDQTGLLDVCVPKNIEWRDFSRITTEVNPLTSMAKDIRCFWNDFLGTDLNRSHPLYAIAAHRIIVGDKKEQEETFIRLKRSISESTRESTRCECFSVATMGTFFDFMSAIKKLGNKIEGPTKMDDVDIRKDIGFLWSRLVGSGYRVLDSSSLVPLERIRVRTHLIT